MYNRDSIQFIQDSKHRRFKYSALPKPCTEVLSTACGSTPLSHSYPITINGLDLSFLNFAFSRGCNLPLAKFWHSRASLWNILFCRISSHPARSRVRPPARNQSQAISPNWLKLNSGWRLYNKNMVTLRSHHKFSSLMFSARPALACGFVPCGCKVTAAPLSVTYLCWTEKEGCTKSAACLIFKSGKL